MLLSPDEKTLYVALTNLDQIAAVSTSDGTVTGYFSTTPSAQEFPAPIPRHWRNLLMANISLWPIPRWMQWRCLTLRQHLRCPTRKIRRLQWDSFLPIGTRARSRCKAAISLIATAKGEGAGPNKQMGKTADEIKHHQHAYIATLIKGSVARLNIASTLKQLPQLTQTVERDNLFHSDPGTIERLPRGQTPIKHVIYVLKENRTYDQVLGDLKVGNGDASLTMYGEDITPNEHKLALQFGVLDNFYDSGEVSGDGHVWSMAAITSDYNEKTWQIAYRGKERTYDFQGQVADEFPLEHNQSDVDDPGTGFIWDNLARNHVSFRVYGEFVNAEWCNVKRKAANPKEGTPSGQESKCTRTELHQGDTLPPNVGDPHGGRSPWPWAVPLFSGVKPTKAVLRDHFDPLYPDFNTDYPDQLRADEFLNEFSAFVRGAGGSRRAGVRVTVIRSALLTRTIIRGVRGLIRRARRPMLRITTSRLAASWTPCRTVPIGTTLRFSYWKTTHKMARTTWMRIARLRSSSASILQVRQRNPTWSTVSIPR